MKETVSTNINGNSKMRHYGRVLILATATTYRVEAFSQAAARLGLETLIAVDMPQELATFWNTELGIDFSDLDQATRRIATLVAEQPVDAIIAVDDSGTLLAAYASAALNLPHNSIVAAEAARDKYRMRALLAQAGVAVPTFRLCSTSDDPQVIASEIEYPCVVKPLRLSGSRGVIRADDPDQFVAVVQRLASLLHTLEPELPAHPYLVEGFVPGFEVALEGLLDNGQLQVLALFDKPDPLDGPFFEETIYVTPSRLPQPVQVAIAAYASDAAAALGLRNGPMHAELRVNDAGPWLIEVASRSIGGLCSQTLRFGTDASLEELILRQACGLPIESFVRAGHAGGVMMIPIPGAGMLKCVRGVVDAEAVPGVETVEITAKLHYPLIPLPEGDSYLGFIFARGTTPDEVEAALREAHRRLHFEIESAIPLIISA